MSFELEASRKPRWLCVTNRRQELCALSEPTVWHSHFDPMVRQSRRCAGRNCALCCEGQPVILRWVLLVCDNGGRQYWFELRERHRGFLERVRGEVGSMVGVRFSVVKKGNAQNSPVEVSLVGYGQALSHEICNFVATLGLVAQHSQHAPDDELVDIRDPLNVSDGEETKLGSFEGSGGT